MAVPDIRGSLNLSGSSRGKIAQAIVCLEDTTEADAASIIVGRTECRAAPQSPARARFLLSVPDELLLEGRQYTLSARAEVDCGPDRKLFGTVQSYPLQPGGEGVTDLELRELD